MMGQKDRSFAALPPVHSFPTKLRPSGRRTLLLLPPNPGIHPSFVLCSSPTLLSIKPV
jgi:hypothetical protein